MIRHIILAYGPDTEHRRAIFAILSFWAWYTGDRADAQTVVFTDRPEVFAPHLAGLPVAYEPLTAARIEEMYGPHRYIHRVKLTIIDQVMRSNPHDDVLFCDSDTFFIAGPGQLLRRLRPGFSIMHVREYRFARAIPKWATPAYAKLLQSGIDMVVEEGFVVDAKRHPFQTTQFMWNAGVLGFTQEVVGILPDVFALMDRVYARSRWVLSEQMAFSLVLPTKTRLLSSDQFVFHYWPKPLKVLMDKLLLELLGQEFSELALAARLARVQRLTTQWPSALVIKNTRQEVRSAFSNGEVMTGIKTALLATRLISRSPFSPKFAKNLFLVLKQPVKQANAS